MWTCKSYLSKYKIVWRVESLIKIYKHDDYFALAYEYNIKLVKDVPNLLFANIF